ncbi:MAG: GNAT family N-acetyltransferase [Candidatus Binataceae bacterium]
MTGVTPDFHLKTCFVLDERDRIISTREPEPLSGPIFTLIRSASSCVWAVRADVPEFLAAELGRFAAEEPPLQNPQDSPVYADKYQALAGGQIESGPAFTFPDEITRPTDVTLVDNLNLRLLERNFRGWTAFEIPGRSPILAIIDGGYPVSVCFCTRITEEAAEAGVETAPAFRGRGFAMRVTEAWAAAIRASGRIPLYSTSWSNAASRAVARKLGLVQYASNWSLVGNFGT